MSPTLLPSLPPTLPFRTQPVLPEFDIALMNMGNITTFDSAFQMAKQKWETIIVGDVRDHSSKPGDFDWFANAWPGLSTNGPVDDILIGYSFEHIDGMGGTLGFAGPVYVRNVKNKAGQTISVTTISA
jgi:hypothetical protein